MYIFYFSIKNRTKDDDADKDLYSIIIHLQHKLNKDLMKFFENQNLKEVL